MTTHHLMTADGTIVLRGAMLHAQRGPHAGTHWRLDDVVHNGIEHVLRCTRLVGHSLRARMDFHPSVFGLTMVEMTNWLRASRECFTSLRHKVDDAILAGSVALIPLAMYDVIHGGERAQELLSWLVR